eukprot:scaffold21101_cov56-Attheya_sp.AAC.6
MRRITGGLGYSEGVGELHAILLAVVRDFGWTHWWTYVGCFGPVEKISIMLYPVLMTVKIKKYAGYIPIVA